MRYLPLLFLTSLIGTFSYQNADAQLTHPPSTPRCQTPSTPKPFYHVREQAPNKSTYRWLGAEPIVPLALVQKREISSAGQARCKAWANRKQIWQAVDAYGQITGEFRVKASQYYDVSRCEELAMEPIGQNRPGAGLFVAKDSGWKSPMSVKWTPTTAEEKSLKEFIISVEKHFSSSEKQSSDAEPSMPLLKRTLFFWVPALDGHETPSRYAVIGGPFLLVASLEANCHWVIHSILSEHIWPDNQREYQPLAVFDMNHDGAPEIIFHHKMGPEWDDEILSLTNGTEWRQVARSVGGATW